MTSLWAALNRVAPLWRYQSDPVVERVNKAFSEWTQRTDFDLQASKPLGFEVPETVPEPEASTLQGTQSPAVSINDSAPVVDSAVKAYEDQARISSPEPAAISYRHELSNPDWPAERVDLPFDSQPPDYYEVLQISRSADSETIHRVYRMMAARFHPDNTLTGNLEKFIILRRAYEVLSRSELRAEYDRSFGSGSSGRLSIFRDQGFVAGHHTEINRRLGVLSLLYNRRRMNEDRPGLSTLDLERLMSLPREYLQFTIWYLKSKAYITVEDHSDYCVTPAGVDYLEQMSGKNRLIHELVTGEMKVPSSNPAAEAAQAGQRSTSTPSPRKARRGEARRARRAQLRRGHRGA